MRKIQIIQPIVPHYRVAFFAALARRADIRIRLDASDAVPGEGSLKLATLPADVPLALHKCFSFLGHRVFWQKGVRLDPELRSGDVLVLNGNPRYLSNFPLIAAARRRGIGIVWWGHGWSSTSTSLAAYVRRKLMQFADVLLLYMDHEVGEFTRLGFSQERVFATGNAIDQKAIRQAAERWNEIDIAEFRRTNGLIGKHLLLFCGRLTNKAHLELALQALHRLGRHGDYVLAVIGEGDAAKKLRILSCELGISEHIRWLGPLTEQADIAPWFLAADCFVYPGAIGLSLMHAFGYGVPVITHGNRARQMPEARALEHLKNGFLFAEGDMCSLTDGIRFVCEDPVQRRSLSQCALRTASGYSIENMTENFVRAASVAAMVAAKGRAHGLAPKQIETAMRSRFARRFAMIGTIVHRALGRDNITNQSIASVTRVEKIGSHYGGWVVPVDLLNRDSICYCAGVGEDATFDIGLIRRFGCDVYAMDPTPRAIAHAEKVARDVQKFRFVPVGLWDSDSEVQFFAPRDPRHVSHSAMNLQRTADFFVGKCRRLRNLMADHGHEQLTLLKLDVEGAEYKVINSIIEDRIPIRILCVEFDEINCPLDDRYRERIIETVRKLSSIGYRIIAVDGSANYTFLKLDAN